MKTTRRNFFKVIAATVVGVGLSVTGFKLPEVEPDQVEFLGPLARVLKYRNKEVSNHERDMMYAWRDQVLEISKQTKSRLRPFVRIKNKRK